MTLQFNFRSVPTVLDISHLLYDTNIIYVLSYLYSINSIILRTTLYKALIKFYMHIFNCLTILFDK
jgi:hypothetical protein